MSMHGDQDVIVIGAGLAGLTAAAAARKAGARVVVLEAHRPGGRARTVEREGFVLNMGAHALYRRGPGMRVLASLGITPQGAAPPLNHYRAQIGDHQGVLPVGPTTLLRTDVLGARSKTQLVRLLGLLPLLRPAALRGQSVAGWLATRQLRPDTEAVVRALVRLSTYSADVDEFAADAAVAQLQMAARGGVLYLHRGWAQLTEALSGPLDVKTGVQVDGVRPVADGIEVRTQEGTLSARRVVVAAGGPDAVRRLLPDDPGWGELGPAVTASCLDLGVSRPPRPGYVLSLDEPVYVTVQSPPALQAPEGQGVVAAIRYGARSAEEDRTQLERMVVEAGVDPDTIVVRRFLARMAVTGAMPLAATGGLAGRPRVEHTGVPGVTVAGDWVGPEGLLADAALVSGRAAGLLAGRSAAGSTKLVA